MTHKVILAAIDNSKHATGVVSVATDLAQRCGAHLIGLYAVYADAGAHDLQDPSWQVHLQAHAAKVEEQAARARARFDKYTEAVLDAKAEFRRATQDALSAVTVNARYADLVVIGQRDPDEPGTGVPANLVDRALLAVGRPVLVVPYYANAYPSLGRNVLVAWNGSRESARAVRDALPLLQQAERVVVMAVNPRVGSKEHGELPGADLAQYLARHGVKAEARASVAPELGAGDELLARASDLSADLLVMGAYGHSRLQELVMGGATQTMLEHMTLPVFMSH